METKYVRVPFEVELAKEISNGSKEGRIVTRDGRNARVLCFDVKDALRHIIALVDCGDIERDYTYDNNGRYYERIENEKDLMLEVPEYMTFKDGDVIKLSNNGYTWISIIKEIGKMPDGRDGYLFWTSDYASILCYIEGEEVEFDSYSDAATRAEKASDKEKQVLIDALKASNDPRAKECLKKLGIEEKPKYEFKPFDKVLVRDDSEGIWCADIFSHIDERDYYHYICIGSNYKDCIPYNEKTAHLLGTKENYE